jgi:hypothetical protein
LLIKLLLLTRKDVDLLKKNLYTENKILKRSSKNKKNTMVNLKQKNVKNNAKGIER